ncbi:MAG: monovalent cation/H(+) antiporter subunit G [Pseudomonadota bacterium]|nr:monovalent cation/H(+) antiporter subunit G [Pseudomonadota bacterium]
MSILSSFLMLVGCVTLLIGTIGLFRFNDFLSRTHAASVVDTLSTLLIISALIINSGLTLYSLKLLLILIFLYITSTTAIHALSQVFLKDQSKKGE